MRHTGGKVALYSTVFFLVRNKKDRRGNPGNSGNTVGLARNSRGSGLPPQGCLPGNSRQPKTGNASYSLRILTQSV